LLTTNLIFIAITAGLRLVIQTIDVVCGSGEGTQGKALKFHEQRYSNDPVYAANPGFELDISEIDAAATLKKSTYPISPKALIAKCKTIIANEFGTRVGGQSPDELLADDFHFVAPIVGPLVKSEFLSQFGKFKLREALPDFKENNTFQVDPLEPNRVWFLSRATGTHTGPLTLPGLVVAATGAKICMPPQASSMLFDAQGLCYTLTVGYTMDKRIGNTSGLGALFGILKAVGKPIPAPEGNALYTQTIGFEAILRIGKAFEPAHDGGKKTN